MIGGRSIETPDETRKFQAHGHVDISHLPGADFGPSRIVRGPVGWQGYRVGGRCADPRPVSCVGIARVTQSCIPPR